MSRGFKVALVLIVAGALAIVYGLLPAPSTPGKVFKAAIKQAETRDAVIVSKIETVKKIKQKAKVKADASILTAHEYEAAYADIKPTSAPVEDKLASADKALAACMDQADALIEVVQSQNDEIQLHEEREEVLTNEIELFSARVDELEAENASLRRKQILVTVGLVAILAGGAGIFVFGL